tara:strand:+ start:2026 stop:3516 length:1491 start_codon:yes stop_codon:yes gene_type:complete
MKDLDDIVENYFKPKDFLGLEKLLQLIEEQIDFSHLLQERRGPEEPSEESTTIDIKFPKLRITEDFGKVGSEDRVMIEKFTKNITGETLEAKILSLNNILQVKKEATISEILSTMVICEILSSIVAQFTEGAAGFIFEGFLAGLFGGQSVQITDPGQIAKTTGGEGGEQTGKPITDVLLGDKHYSLKLLGPNTEVKGSFKNMVEHFAGQDHVIYLDARRVGKDQGLEFGEFIITLDNFLDVFVTPFLKEVYKKEVERYESAAEFQVVLKKIVDDNLAIKYIGFARPGFFAEEPRSRSFKFSPSKESDPEALEEQTGLGKTNWSALIQQILEADPEKLDAFKPFAIQYAERKFEKTKAEGLFGSMAVVEQLTRAIQSGNKQKIIGSLRKTVGYVGQKQFIFTKDQALKISGFRPIGTLMIGKEHMQKLFVAHASLLKQTISPIYEQLQFFTNNINDYFLGVGEEEAAANRKQYALKAIENAQILQKATDNAVKKIEK